jgi:hypothetical protein
MEAAVIRERDVPIRSKEDALVGGHVLLIQGGSLFLEEPSTVSGLGEIGLLQVVVPMPLPLIRWDQITIVLSGVPGPENSDRQSL